MSTSSISGRSSGWGLQSMQQRMKPPDLTKDQLSQIEQKMKADGKDTSNLDKIISNFDQLDTDQDGKISKSEMDNGASQFGIELPKGPPPGPPPGGPPPGFQMSGKTDSTSSTDDTTNTLLQQLLKQFSSSDPSSSDSTFFNSIDTAA